MRDDNCYIRCSFEDFHTNKEKLLEEINDYSNSYNQIEAWKKEFEILDKIIFSDNKYTWQSNECSQIGFEYEIPRVGGRIDTVLIYKGLVYILEFKTGNGQGKKKSIEQLLNYYRKLKAYHKESQERKLIPILVLGNKDLKIKKIDYKTISDEELYLNPIICSTENLKDVLIEINKIGVELTYKNQNIIFDEKYNNEDWFNSDYETNPTIIEQVIKLYMNNKYNDKSAIQIKGASESDFEELIAKIDDKIEECKKEKKHFIYIVNGVPGAGKTLIGLETVINRMNKYKKKSDAIYVSGNTHLIKVLQKTLEITDKNERINSDKKIESSALLQDMINFRKTLLNEKRGIENVVIFDEAQRSWTDEQLKNHLKTNKKNFSKSIIKSEIELILDKLTKKEWSVLILLVGEDQEINKGEMGIDGIDHIISVNKLDFCKSKLKNSKRTYKNEQFYKFVQSVLKSDIENAKKYYKEINEQYFKVFITRDLKKAKEYLNRNCRFKKCGLLAQSNSKRLIKYGFVPGKKSDDQVINYFLGNKDDIRSSDYLEVFGTEYDTQGLEIDWSILCWDSNLIYNENNKTWNKYKFAGSRWTKIKNEKEVKYLINSYRVLMTRARDGMIIFIPPGDKNDISYTMTPDRYDSTYIFFKEIGIKEIK